MAGAWEIKDGAYRRLDNPPKGHTTSSTPTPTAEGDRRQVLVYAPTDEEMTSISVLSEKLTELGWELKHGDDHKKILEFRKESMGLVIRLPKDFSKLMLEHMEAVVSKNRDAFYIRD